MIILNKGEKTITVRASKRARVHKRKIKISDKPKESPFKRALDFYESTIKDQDYESCGAFKDDGSIVFQKDGEKNRIGINDEEMDLLEGATFTHNHPKGFSFSPEDILCACDGKMKEMRCVSKDSVYSMKLKNGKNFSPDLWKNMLADTYIDISNSTHTKFENAIDNGEMTIDQAINWHWDTVWGLVSEQCPEIEYKKVI